MYPCEFALSTRGIAELAARRAIREIEGGDIEDLKEYIDHSTDKYARMVEWIRKELDVTSLKYQTSEHGASHWFPGEKLCFDCWSGGSA